MNPQQILRTMELQTKIITDVKRDRQKIILAILEKSDAKIRIRNIRQLLLELQVREEDDKNMIDIFREFKGKMKDVANVATFDSVDQLNRMAETMKLTFKPYSELKDQTSAIADIIRSSELNDEDKIDRISNILI
jgi:hypothetical protein